MTSRKKAIEKLLKNITFERTTTFSNNKGPVIQEKYRRPNSKDRRHSGRVEGRIIHPKMKWSEIYAEAIDPREYYDDWRNYRDSYRRWYIDASRFKKGMNRKRYNHYTKQWQTPEHINKKLIKELEIRRAAKKKHLNSMMNGKMDAKAR